LDEQPSIEQSDQQPVASNTLNEPSLQRQPSLQVSAASNIDSPQCQPTLQESAFDESGPSLEGSLKRDDNDESPPCAPKAKASRPAAIVKRTAAFVHSKPLPSLGKRLDEEDQESFERSAKRISGDNRAVAREEEVEEVDPETGEKTKKTMLTFITSRRWYDADGGQVTENNGS